VVNLQTKEGRFPNRRSYKTNGGLETAKWRKSQKPGNTQVPKRPEKVAVPVLRTDV
jgi:hypothetical protein